MYAVSASTVRKRWYHKIIQVTQHIYYGVHGRGAEIQRNGGVGVRKSLQCVGFADQKHLKVLLVVAK